MTLTQLQYITAVSEFGSFMKAAEACYVTQPTLSMQIKKFEESLNIQIFDRSKKPIQPTTIGKRIIEQAKVGISEIEKINRIIEFNQYKNPSHLKIGIIPTLCPYLTPLFLAAFSKKYPTIKIEIKELTTKDIMKSFNEGLIDLGILIKPEKMQESLIHIPIFQEPLVAYIAESHPLFYMDRLSPSDVDKNELWLLEDCHCLHDQILELCEKTPKIQTSDGNNHYRVGGLETARRLVESQNGYTILPELATLEFNSKQVSRIRKFHTPIPAREVSMVCHKNFSYEEINLNLVSTIRENLPEQIKVAENKAIEVLPL